MITIEKADVWGFEHAVRGMRNPLNSWERSDTRMCCEYGRMDCTMEGRKCPYPHGKEGFICVGDNDRELMKRLIHAGSSHRKFLRQIFVSVDITAPLYWWKEFDTYKVGTTANSCSTMHTIHTKEFTKEDFSIEHLIYWDINGQGTTPMGVFVTDILKCLNRCRELYLKEENPEIRKVYWWQMIQLLPESYNQKRTVTMTYENLYNILETRRGHKLDEWNDFCDWILTLPCGELLNE